MGRYGAVGGFIRVKGIVHPFCFFEGFKLFDDTAGYILGLFPVTYASMPEVSKRSMEAGHITPFPASMRIVEITPSLVGLAQEILCLRRRNMLCLNCAVNAVILVSIGKYL